MNDDLVRLILEKIQAEKDNIYKEYSENKKKTGIGFVAIKNLLPEEITMNIYKSFPKDSNRWRLMDSFREKKYTSKQFDKMPKILSEITFAFQDSAIIRSIENAIGLNHLDADPTLYAGGLSMMEKSHFLDPHIDNSHDQHRTKYRRLNLLYYVTPNWKEQDGGHLSLWDEKVINNTTIPSEFNTLVLMETHSTSWHSVSTVNRDDYRCCVSNYYFSEVSPSGEDYFHITAFMATPDKKFTRVFNYADNFLRSSIRKVIKGGIGKKDLYQSNDKE
jgi:Rps23 Pro-64 3,4-dihydroxylase Tpa1-like proline 4-hydroxylase